MVPNWCIRFRTFFVSSTLSFYSLQFFLAIAFFLRLRLPFLGPYLFQFINPLSAFCLILLLFFTVIRFAGHQIGTWWLLEPHRDPSSSSHTSLQSLPSSQTLFRQRPTSPRSSSSCGPRRHLVSSHWSSWWSLLLQCSVLAFFLLRQSPSDFRCHLPVSRPPSQSFSRLPFMLI